MLFVINKICKLYGMLFITNNNCKSKGIVAYVDDLLVEGRRGDGDLLELVVRLVLGAEVDEVVVDLGVVDVGLLPGQVKRFGRVAGEVDDAGRRRPGRVRSDLDRLARQALHAARVRLDPELVERERFCKIQDHN